jgi:D-alanyl-D-alanine carboxypeptidase
MSKRSKTPAETSKFLYLLILGFVFIASSALVLSKKKVVEAVLQVVAPEAKQAPRQYPPLPKLSQDAGAFPIISAQAALVVDLDSMVPLYEKNPDTPLLPASTTKIVTALVAMDYFSDDAVLTVDGLKIPGQTMGLIRGETLTAKSLLEGLLIYSANDAAEVLAENYVGGRSAFIEAMNVKAKELKLINSHFENPTGFDNGTHYSTARDLIRVSQIAMQNPRFSRIVKIKEETVTSVDGKTKHRLVSTNELLGSVPGVLGVKTGWTEEARENLVTYIERDGHRVMFALLGSQDRFGETKELINWTFTNYKWEEVSYPSE